jgi:GNAT superfamily N-acetyltransferase
MATVRGYEPRDLEACRGLWEELTQQHRDIFDSPEIGGDDPGRAFDEHLAKTGTENLWVAEADGHVVGLAGLIPGVVAQLEPVSVTRESRGQGIGRLLVERVVAAARTGNSRTIQVRPVARNVDAVRFFHSLGFDILGQLDLEMDFVARGREVWLPGERLAGRDFRF